MPIGWPLLPLPDAHGQLSYPTLEQSVRQSIRCILRTRPGEQLKHPNFGAGLQNFLNEPNPLTTRRRIQEAMLGSLAGGSREHGRPSWTFEVPDIPGRLRIELAYRTAPHRRRADARA